MNIPGGEFIHRDLKILSGELIHPEIPCRGRINFGNRPLCLIPRTIYVPRECEKLKLDMFSCVYQVFKVESWEIRDGGKRQFQWSLRSKEGVSSFFQLAENTGKSGDIG